MKKTLKEQQQLREQQEMTLKILRGENWVKTYDLDFCEALMRVYAEIGGKVVTLQEGSLGLGLVLCYGYGLKTVVITEKYVNCWTSTHTIDVYSQIPEKYKTMLDAVEAI